MRPGAVASKPIPWSKSIPLLPEVNIALKPKLLRELRPGARVISNNVDMGRWVPDRHEKSQSSGGIHQWVIPEVMPI